MAVLGGADVFLEVVMPFITDSGYGFFPGGAPRDFAPGSDATEEEAETPRRACEAWDRGERTSKADCARHPGLSVTRCQFGLGSYTCHLTVGWRECLTDRVNEMMRRVRWNEWSAIDNRVARFRRRDVA
jgi:hypothetical protein